ncbi:hydrogenase expression/formation protein HypE [Desulfurobacterium sp.]
MEKIEIAHGSGGKLTRELIEQLFLKYLDFEELKSLQDASYLTLPSCNLAMTTDSYVVKPFRFPGGNTGKLSVCGTINDLTVSGAIPRYLSLGLIIEEGLPLKELEEIIATIAKTAKEAGIAIATGDTKVVESGKCDGIYINTAGIGEIKRTLSPQSVKPGDVIIITGYVGDHGIAISLAREEFDMEIPVKSDCAPLNNLLIPIFEIPGLKWMRDPTRGGVATVAVELSEMSGYGIKLFENQIPVREEVKFVCDMLGYDPLYLANEGKALIVVDKKDAEKTLELLKKHPLGRESAIIGEVTDAFKGVRLKTRIGGERLLDLLEDDPLPRIC